MPSLYMLVLTVVLLVGYLLRKARAHRAWELADYERGERKHAALMRSRPPYNSQLTASHSAPPSASLASLAGAKLVELADAVVVAVHRGPVAARALMHSLSWRGRRLAAQAAGHRLASA